MRMVSTSSKARSRGAFTLWNTQTKKASRLQATLHDISIGIPGATTSGTGIFICGSKEHGTNVVVDILRTGAIYSDEGIGSDVPDVISGGVGRAWSLKTHEPSIAPFELEGEIANLIISDGIGLGGSALSGRTEPLKGV